ncbi:hypothetical protein COV19_03685 [Candidatus Woesearchaeota archaeon CG10_big_fil_rev_8_21_14_0_10_44_13]|nr:MAG: hypothetical protein COV19_03685 [Candidatus Woesearchaeota archaeon CG10_big_fil_rev_8_21_14_0_10_44_13]
MSDYIFLWGNSQSNLTLQANIVSALRHKDIPWNRIEKMVLVSRNNRIYCFHSKKSAIHDKELSRKFFDKKFAEKLFKRMNTDYAKHWKFFDVMWKTDYSRLSDKDLMKHLTKAIDNWSLIIGYFRATQTTSTHYLDEKLKKIFGDKDTSLLMLSPELDSANREIISWQNLVKCHYSGKKLLNHARKYPWVVAFHLTYKDVIDTLRHRFEYDRKNLLWRDVRKEKEELKKKQKQILKNKPHLKPVVDIVQKLALSRMQIKSCWAGTDFYLMPLINEISKRTGESVQSISKYYLIEEIKMLLDGRLLSEQEKQNRKLCFVGLLKDGKEIYESGDEAEKLAKKELKDLYEVKETSEIKGDTANPGNVVGIARILESNNVEQTRGLRASFKKGEILITQMTQPSIMDIAGRASAIVTDEGGMLSHAAIISREFDIPCIVGTHFATTLIKDGEMIEVDANKGTVRKIKKIR